MPVADQGVQDGKYSDFLDGAILKRTLDSDSWLVRKGKSGFLRIKRREDKQDWVRSILPEYGNFELASPEESAWFEYCEKNQAFTSFEDFRSLGSKAKLPSPNYKKGDKVRMIRVPMHDEWKAIKEPVQDISDMLGKVYTVYHCQTGSWVSLVEHDNFYPIECFEPVLDATPTEVPHGTLVQADYIVPELKLYKKKTIVTFDTEVERVKDLSNIKLFKPSKNRYT